MNVVKRKSDECHYCANQKRHECKRSKLTTRSAFPIPKEPMIPVQGNFKCRGRGGKEIEFPHDDWIPLNGVHNPKSGQDVKKNGIYEKNHCHKPEMNFKPQRDNYPMQNNTYIKMVVVLEGEEKVNRGSVKSSLNRTNPPKHERSRSSRLSRSGRASLSCRSDLGNKQRPTSGQPKPKLRSSAVEQSIKSEKTSRPERVVNQHRTSEKLSLLSSNISDGQPSTDESSVTTCLTRSKYIRKVVESSKQASKYPKLSSSQKKNGRDSQPSVEELRSLRSNESVHDFLVNVSEDLQRERLLGKLGRTRLLGRSNRSNGLTNIDRFRRCGDIEQSGSRSLEESVELEHIVSNLNSSDDNLKQKQTVQRFSKPTKSSSTDLSLFNSRRAKRVNGGDSFWMRVFHVFSLGCWKADVTSTSPSIDRKSEAEFSRPGESSSSESSSTSTGTTTVAACGRPNAKVRETGVRSAERTILTTGAPSRSSSSGDKKQMAAKLVESLKRFFSRHRKSDNETEKNAVSESSSVATSSEEISELSVSSSAPLNPKRQSLSPNQQPPLQLLLDTTALSLADEFDGLNKPLILRELAESPLSTENEKSDSEIVDICPMHKQPM